MPERLLLPGTHAAAYGAMLSRAEVISAYPITPQTMIVELLSELTASGKLNATFMTVESGHSAMDARVGAAGGRMLFAEAGREAQDFIIWSYGVAEQVHLPAMVGMAAFILSHTAEPLI